MKLFYVSAANCGYDDYDSFVIIAQIKKQVQKILERHSYEISDEEVDVSKTNNVCVPYFSASQEPISIEEIKVEDCKKPTIICASFNAG